MKLRTAINETILREASVVAGNGNLDQEITWVHIVDHPDIVDWVKRGELLLTTGYNWPMDEDASRRLVQQLSAVGLAGVVLAVPHFREHFPPGAIEEADNLGVPLLELPWEVQFSQVTHEILAKIIYLQAETIERSERLHRALTNAAVSANSLSDIALALSSLLSRPVIFSDVNGQILGGSEAHNAMTRIEPQLVDVLKGAHFSRLVDERRPVLVDFELPEGPLQRLCLPVRLHELVVSLIWLDYTGDSNHELDARAIEHASVVAALHLMHQQQLSQQEARLGYALVAGLLDGEFNPTTSALERARVCGWSEARQYRVCLLLLDEPIPLTPDGLDRRERWTELLRRQLSTRGLPVLLAVWLNQIKFIIPADAPLNALWDSVSDRRSALAVSRIHSGVKGMALGSQDVDALVPSLRPGRMHQFDEILFPRALMGDSTAREMLLERLVKPLTGRRRGESLLETLFCLADEGFQLANTAKALTIHISTLRYRLERIEQMLSVSFEDPHIRFQIQVAVTLYRLMNE